MSAADSDTMMCCANCGKAEGDDVKLKICTACKLVKYCGVECQKNHRPRHKKECKKRMAEIRDDRLFTQPDESHLGECPICFLPLSLDLMKSPISSCCSQRICQGCDYANKKREEEKGPEQRCLFCREPVPKTKKEADQKEMIRVKANDPLALYKVGYNKCFVGGDYEGAVKYWTKAAGLGEMDAHYQLASMYDRGLGVDKDKKKAAYHLEEAAIGGHPGARYNLGILERDSGRHDRAAKHWIIAANLGHDESLQMMRLAHGVGFVRKEDFEAALRGHQAAVDATKSKQREEAYAFFDTLKTGKKC